MEKRCFAGIKTPVSLLGFGLMRLPLLQTAGQQTASQASTGQPIDYATAEKMVDRALEAGVNYFDTAWTYHDGASEIFAGQALARHPREKYLLASKLPTWEIKSAEDVERIFAEQLKRCRVEFFDFYLVHSLNEDYYRIALETGVYELLLRKKEQGLIRHLGFSFHDHADLLERIVAGHGWDFAQIQLNYLDWEAQNAKRQYEILERKNIPVIVMEPIRGGALATLNPEARKILSETAPEASPASWALRYAASLPGVLTVLSGMSTPEQLEDNLATFSNFEPVSDGERNLLYNAAAIFRRSGGIGCTGCAYCTPCPFKVDIPHIFSFYNHYSLSKNWYDFDNLYATLPAAARAESCTSCGVCVPKCPQALAIPELIGKIAEFAKEGAEQNS